VVELARYGAAHIYFTGRNPNAGNEVSLEAQKLAPATQFTFIQSDLAATRESLRKDVMTHFKSNRLDMLIANAGIMNVAPATTAEGFEVQFGTNYLGHAILLRLLLPTMLRTAKDPCTDVRLVTLSSYGHTMHPPGGIVFDQLRTADAGTGWQRYGQSKLADILLAKAMAKRYPQITSVSVHPGLVMTGLADRSEPSWLGRLFSIVKYTPFMKSSETGAHNTLWAATTSKSDLVNGGYYTPVGNAGRIGAFGEAGMDEMVNDEDLADRLWEWTERELGDFKL